MAQKRAKTFRDIPYKDVSIQEQYVDHDEICQCFKNCSPPPPPGREDLWDLQFCRWWGWNWVRKRQIENESKNIPKKTFKDLCNCLPCITREPKPSPLQNLYNTPSNTVVHDTYPSEVAKKEMDSVRNLEIQRNISEENKRTDNERNRCVKSTSTKAQDELTWSSDECHCCRTNRHRSSTDDSVEYIKINCCQCRHHVELPSPEKLHCETQTVVKATNVNVTQTNECKENVCVPESKKRKKKRICVICCHCCKCRGEAAENKLEIGKQIKTISRTRENSTQSDNNFFTTTPKPPEKRVRTLDEQIENSRSNVRLNLSSKYRLETLLYCNDFPQFALPSQNYFKFYNRSDVMAKLNKFGVEDKFSSPISGEIYNLSPMKVDIFGQKPTILPEPIDVSADIKRLKKIENEFQTDHESRVLLDAVCDAILYKNRCHTTSSTILNEFTYSYKEPESHNLNKLFKTDDKFQLPTRNSIFDEINYFGSLNDSSKPNDSNNTDANDIIKSLMLNYDINEAPLQKLPANNTDYQWTNIIKSNVDMQRATQPNTTLPNEWTSSVLSNQGIKEKPKDIPNSDMYNTNINDIFDKIEEIILKSKVNDEEIQNVLNIIPKGTSHRLSSEEITCGSNVNDFRFKNRSRQDCTFEKDIEKGTFSNTCHQKSTIPISNVKRTPKKTPTEMFKDEDESKMLPAKKRKKNVKPPISPVNKTDKFKSCKRK